jgi:hypothetical protein
MAATYHVLNITGSVRSDKFTYIFSINLKTNSNDFPIQH